MKTKHRILSVLTVLALLASLTAVMAAPAMAQTALFVPTSGPVGTVVTVAGAAWAAAGEAITAAPAPATGVTVGGVHAVHTLAVAAGGTLSGTITIPTPLTIGLKDIVITGATTGPRTFVAAFTVTTAVAVSPTSGHVGSVVTLRGSGFTPGPSPTYTHITSVTFAGVAVTTSPALPVRLDPFGAFPAISFTVPASIRGSRPIVVSDGVRSATVHFTVEPRVTLSAPLTGPRGTTRTATVTGFTAGVSVDVFAGGTLVAEVLTAGTRIGGGVTTDATGGATVPVTMTAIGLIRARDGAGHWSMHHPHTFSPFTPGITLDPTTGTVGLTVEVRGSDFTLMGQDAVVGISVGGILIDPAPAAITTPEAGADAFTRRIVIPAGMTPGPKVVSVTVTGEPVTTATFTVAPSTLTLTPASGPVGTVVTISGSGFLPNRSGSVAAADVIAAVPFTTTAAGTIPTGITATIIAGAPVGARTLTATVGVEAASATFTVLAPTITVSPTSGAPGTVVTVTGIGFVPFSTLGILTIGPHPLPAGVIPATVTPIPTVITDSVGNFTATFVIPGLAAGATTVTATVGVAPPVAATLTIIAAPVIVTVETGLATVWPALDESVWEFRGGVWHQYFIARPDLVPAAVRLTRLERGRAYWIYLTRPITDVHFGGMTRTLPAGWNAIGWN